MKSFRRTKSKEDLQEQQVKEEQALPALEEFFNVLASAKAKEIVEESTEEHIIMEQDENVNNKPPVLEVVEPAPIKEDIFELPKPPQTDQNIVAIQRKVDQLQTWISKITIAGPGSGETRFKWLDDVNRTSIGSPDQMLKYNFCPTAPSACVNINQVNL